MSRKVAFLCGLPRSGSTLLANLLDQHDKISVTGTSGLAGLVDTINRHFVNNFAEKASKSGNHKNTLKSVITSYHDSNSEIIIDKNRAWPSYLHYVANLHDYNPYVIVCVRDVRDICASLEKLYNKRPLPWPDELNAPGAFANIDSRIDAWMGPEGLIGGPLRRLVTLSQIPNINIHLIGYQVLLSNPKEICDKIFSDLEVESFSVKTEDFTQTVIENDEVWGLGPELHKIKTDKIIPNKSNWREVIGERFESLSKFNFWIQ